MLLHQQPRGPQTETCRLERIACRDERVERALRRVERQAGTFVNHAKHDRPVLGGQLHHDRSGRLRERVLRVHQQVQKRLLQVTTITDDDERGRGVDLDASRQARAPDRKVPKRQRLFGQLPQADRRLHSPRSLRKEQDVGERIRRPGALRAQPRQRRVQRRRHVRSSLQDLHGAGNHLQSVVDLVGGARKQACHRGQPIQTDERFFGLIRWGRSHALKVPLLLSIAPSRTRNHAHPRHGRRRSSDLFGSATLAPMITANWTEWVSSDAWREADVSGIPPPPRSFGEVFSLANENDIDVRRLIRLIASDPVFAIRVLRLANVAAFAAAGEVTSIELAVVRLGTRAVRNAVLAACLSVWAQTIDVYGRRGVDEIQHAVGTACLARRLAERLRIVSDDAFVHGLLHDVGKLFLLKMRGEYLRLGGRTPSIEEFDAVVAARHADIGATALQLWGLPEPVRTPVRWHHEPLSAPSDLQATAVIYLANRLSHRYGFGCVPETDETLTEDPVCPALGLRPGWLDKTDQEALSLGVTARHLVGLKWRRLSGRCPSWFFLCTSL